MDPGDLNGTVVVRNSPEWPEIKTNTLELLKMATRDDWLIVDLADKPWSKAQEDYWESITGKDFDESTGKLCDRFRASRTPLCLSEPHMIPAIWYERA